VTLGISICKLPLTLELRTLAVSSLYQLFDWNWRYRQRRAPNYHNWT